MIVSAPIETADGTLTKLLLYTRSGTEVSVEETKKSRIPSSVWPEKRQGKL